ncbi:MAG: hypothetical protein ABIO67_06860 [Mycobacteriales bacterium]
MTLRRWIVLLALAAFASGCGGSSGVAAAPFSSPPVDTSATDTAAITTAWQDFFTAAGSVDAHIALLQDGEKFRTELTASASDPAAKDLSATVTKVVVNGPSAAVTYNLLGKAGAVLLSGAVGEAVKVGSTWVVSKQTYCQLVSLQDSTHPHPGCS